jgi:hypothetical protein
MCTGGRVDAEIFCWCHNHTCVCQHPVEKRKYVDYLVHLTMMQSAHLRQRQIDSNLEKRIKVPYRCHSGNELWTGLALQPSGWTLSCLIQGSSSCDSLEAAT